MKRYLDFWDSATNTTSVDEDFGATSFVEREQGTPHTVKTINGSSKTDVKYTLCLRGKGGREFNLGFIAIKELASHYGETRVKAPIEIRKSSN